MTPALHGDVETVLLCVPQSRCWLLQLSGLQTLFYWTTQGSLCYSCGHPSLILLPLTPFCWCRPLQNRRTWEKLQVQYNRSSRCHNLVKVGLKFFSLLTHHIWRQTDRCHHVKIIKIIHVFFLWSAWSVNNNKLDHTFSWIYPDSSVTNKNPYISYTMVPWRTSVPTNEFFS